MAAITACTINNILPSDTPNEGRIKINQNFKTFCTAIGASLSGVTSATTIVLAGSNIDVTLTTPLGIPNYTVSLFDDIGVNNLTSSGDSVLNAFTASTMYSGLTNLGDIFVDSVTGGTNINVTGTDAHPIINLDSDISVTSVSATTFYSGTTDLSDIFLSASEAVSASNGLTKTGTNITLGGTLTGDTFIDNAGFLLRSNTYSATTMSAQTVFASNLSGFSPVNINDTIRVDNGGIIDYQGQDLVFRTGSTEFIRFGESGRIKVNDSGLPTLLTFAIDGSTDANFFRADALNNNVGIGTAVSTSRLAIGGKGNTSSTYALTVQNSDSSNIITALDDVKVVLGNTVTPSGSAVLTVRGNTESVGAATLVTHSSAGTRSFQVQDNGQVGIGNLGPLSANSTRLRINGFGDTSSTHALVIQDSGATDIMVVEDGGQVGINTSAPLADLHVDKQAASGSIVRFTSPTGSFRINGSGNAVISTGRYETSSSQYYTFTGDLGVRYARGGAGNASIYAGGGGVGRNIFQGTAQGRVGIGYDVITSWDGNSTEVPATVAVKGEDTTGSTIGFMVANSAETSHFEVYNDGGIRLPALPTTPVVGYAVQAIDTSGTIDFGPITGGAISGDTFVENAYLSGNTIYFDKNDAPASFDVDLTPIIPTASNGLTKTGSNITLGGTLTGDTFIDNSGYLLRSNTFSADTISAQTIHATSIGGFSPVDIFDNLELQNGVTIDAENGGGQLDLRAFGLDDYVTLTTKSGSFEDTSLFMSPTYGGLYFSDSAQTDYNYVELADTYALMWARRNGKDNGIFLQSGVGSGFGDDLVQLNSVTGSITMSAGTGDIYIFNSVATDNTLTSVLARDPSASGRLRQVDISSIAQGGNFLPLSGGTVTGDTVFTEAVSADTITVTTTTVAPLNLPILPISFTSATHGDVWIGADTPGGNAFLNVVVSGQTKTVELT